MNPQDKEQENDNYFFDELDEKIVEIVKQVKQESRNEGIKEVELILLEVLDKIQDLKKEIEKK